MYTLLLFRTWLLRMMMIMALTLVLDALLMVEIENKWKNIMLPIVSTSILILISTTRINHHYHEDKPWHFHSYYYLQRTTNNNKEDIGLNTMKRTKACDCYLSHNSRILLFIIACNHPTRSLLLLLLLSKSTTINPSILIQAKSQTDGNDDNAIFMVNPPLHTLLLLSNTQSPIPGIVIVTEALLRCQSNLHRIGQYLNSNQLTKNLLTFDLESYENLSNVSLEILHEVYDGKAGLDWWIHRLKTSYKRFHSKTKHTFDIIGYQACFRAIIDYIFDHEHIRLNNINSTGDNVNYKKALLFDSRGCFNVAMNDYIQGKTWYEEAMKCYTIIFPDRESLSMATCLNNLATSLASIGETEAALSDHYEALAIRKRYYKGEANLEVAQSLNNLGVVLRKSKRFEEAYQMHKQALEIREMLLGKESIEVISSLHNLAICLKALDRLNEAEEMGKNALSICTCILDDDHPLTIATRKCWGRTTTTGFM
jgi:tetratricopeptide (TPR) repeat protein